MKFAKNKIILLIFLGMTLLSLFIAKKARSHKHRNTHKAHHKSKGRSHHKKQVHLVRDMNGINADPNSVVRRSPSVTTNTKLGAYRLPSPSASVHMANSNTSNSPNVGFLGNSPTIVEPHIVLHSKSPISVVKQTPAHIGYRNEEQTLTSLNVETGKVESHTRNNKVPIYGNIEEVKTVYKNDERSYDIGQKRFGPIRSTITDS